MYGTSQEFFAHYFPKLTNGHSPYNWQTILFDRLISGEWPDSVALPTGAGKTAILQIWVIALAWCAASNSSISIPRRLVWVVNRRVVVDQATDEANAIEAALADLGESDDLKRALASYSYSGRALAVSTLRGEKADNREWSRDPSTPAIIVGTVDMIGSRLLFRGYGDGKYWRPQHAGLLGVDAMIVNDEAHLTPAFARLIVEINKLRPANNIDGKPFHVLLVSATERGLGNNPFEPELAKEISERFRRTYEAEKRLALHEAANAKAAEAKQFELAVGKPAPRTLIFVEKPEDAKTLAERIEKQVRSDRVRLLTGTMRGYERDQLADDSVFRQFKAAAPPKSPVWLVATSAAEVGVDITSERMITMLTESDHLLQRLGRLNRFGDLNDAEHVVAEAHVIHLPPKNKDERSAKENTLSYLQKVAADGANISCRYIHNNPPHPDTRSDEPATAQLQSWLIERWAQTTAGNRSMPEVEKWLHGNEPSVRETEMAWREEVRWLTRDSVSDEDRARAIEAHRVLQHEKLREPTNRVRDKLKQIPDQQQRLLLVSADGTVANISIADASALDRELAYALLLLPPGCGGLSRGMFQTDSTPAVSCDVADTPTDGENNAAVRRRYFVSFKDNAWCWQRLGAAPDEDDLNFDPKRDRKQIGQFAREKGLRLPEIVGISDTDAGESEFLVFFGASPAKKLKALEIELEKHCSAVAEAAGNLAARVLGNGWRAEYEIAGRLHDQGKNRKLWQQAMGGNVQQPLAKTTGAVAPARLAGFRHELASLIDAGKENPDLAAHLVAAHHGWARPYWVAKAYDRENLQKSAAVALESARRYANLQSKWGVWGLAYIEAVFKAADGLVSEQEKGV